MKYTLILSALICFSVTCTADVISLTQEQYDNIGTLTDKLKEKYPQFKGFNGSKEKMEIIGISGASAQAEVSKVNLDEEKAGIFEYAQELARVKKQIVESAIQELEKSEVIKNKEKIIKILSEV